MIKWLQNYAGVSSTGLNIEQVELENLRKEVKRYRKKYQKEDKEMELSSESEKESDQEEQDKFDMEIKKKQQKKKVMRTSVSAEVYGLHNKKEDFQPRSIPKTEEQRKSILDKCGQSFMFNSLEDNELTTIINAFEEKKFKPGEVVIQQGDEGNVIYLVDEGELDCEKVFKKGEEPKHLKVYKPGESFGELALLYNAPRQATITAKTNCILWALDREHFNFIVKDAAIKKRERNEATLKKVDILSTMDAYELGQIADALKSKKVEKNTQIIKQGEEGEEFYLLEEGKAAAYKDVEGKETKVKDYQEGGFFGELALLKNEPRAATVIAETECKLLYLDRKSFKRLLGPLENLLQRNSEKYLYYMKNDNK